MNLSPDPSLKELQLIWEKQFWFKARPTWYSAASFYEDFMSYFGPERKPRDIFRSDVTAWKTWMTKKGLSNTRIVQWCHYGGKFFRFLDELELVEKDFNPFKDMAPRRIA